MLAPLFLLAAALAAAPGAALAATPGAATTRRVDPAAPSVTADPEVLGGLSLLERLEYDRAVVVLGRALTRSDLSRSDRLAGLEALAFAYTILDDRVHADETFADLLDFAPTYQVAAGRSPRLRDGFTRGKKAWEAGRQVGFSLDPTAADVAGTLSGDPRRLGEVRVRTEDGVSEALRCEGSACRGSRPEESFHVELVDHAGTVLATAGPYEGRSVPGSALLPWWVWVAIGVGAVGMSAVVIAAASPGDPPAGTLGTIQLP